MVHEIRIDKAARKLSLLEDGRVVFCCPVALGFAPVGHKAGEGDGKTPEGEFYLCTRNEASKYYRSLGLSYPNPADAEPALKNGRISLKTRDAIVTAHREARRPPWDSALGGFIMIHGGGTQGDWTQGCVAVNDEAMDLLWDACPMGTRVTINP